MRAFLRAPLAPLLPCTIGLALACAGGAGEEPDTRAGAAPAPDASAQEAVNTLSAEERAQGWRLLFDGRTTDGWRGYRRPDMPEGWQVIDGELRRVAAGGDIVTVEQYDDFELSLDWKVAPGGNSGIFFRVSEDADQVWHTGPEMQILDDERHVDGQNPLTSAGSNYALHAPSAEVVRPAGEWNRARLVVRGGRVEHWLNGTKVVEYELGSEDWERRVAASKFAELPRYGRMPRGHIALQDHGDPVAFRNIKIRVP